MIIIILEKKANADIRIASNNEVAIKIASLYS